MKFYSYFTTLNYNLVTWVITLARTLRQKCMKPNKEILVNFAKSQNFSSVHFIPIFQCNTHIHFFGLNPFCCDTDLNRLVILRISESRRLSLHQHKGVDLHAFAYLCQRGLAQCKYIFLGGWITQDNSHRDLH